MEGWRRGWPQISVHNLASRCLNLTFSFMQVLCFFLIVLCIKYHQVDKPPHQRQDDYGGNDEYNQYLPLETGTAEKLPRSANNYLLSFIGYAPQENPQVMVYVIVDEPNVAKQAPQDSYSPPSLRSHPKSALPRGVYSIHPR